MALVAALSLGTSAGYGGTGVPESMVFVAGRTEVGLGYVSDSVYRFGRYNALEDRGLFPLLGLEWFWKRPSTARRPDYVRISGTDLGLKDAGSMSAEFGRRGVYDLRLEHDRIPAYRDAGTRTPYRTDDPAELTLPGDWVPGSDTAAMERLLPALGRAAVRQQRRHGGIALGVHNGQWSFTTRYRQQDRDGTRPLAGTLGTTGGNARAAILPAPIDDRTRTFEAAAAYADPHRQLDLRYHLSLYENAHPALTWDSPFRAVAGWHPSADHPDGQGRLALSPDNLFHQVSLAGGYTVSSRTRLSADIALGRMLQDAAFLPYTVNPALAEGLEIPLPRLFLDGRIDTTRINLRSRHRIGDRFQINTGLRLDDRDNRTSRNEYVTVRGDAEIQDTDPAGSRRRFNLPYSYRSLDLEVDARYRLAGGSRLNASLSHQRVRRTFSEREHVDESRLELGWHQRLSRHLTLGLSGELADRGGSTYDGTAGLRAGYSQGYAESLAGGWLNVPGLRQFHLADRLRHRFTANLSWLPAEAWSIGVQAAAGRDDYHASEIGLTGAESRTLNVDIGYSPSRDWSTWLYAGHERLDTDQAGHSVRGFNRLADLADPERRWFASQDDRINTVGLGVRREWREGRIRSELDYVHTRSGTRLDVAAGAALDISPLPDYESRSHSLKLSGEFRLRPDLSLGLEYWYERLLIEDFALDSVTVDQLAGVILPGESTPDYNVHVFTVSLVWRH